MSKPKNEKAQAKTKPDVVATVVRATQTRSPAKRWWTVCGCSPKQTFPIPNNEANINKIIRSPDGKLESLIDFGDKWYFPTHPLHPAGGVGVPDLLAENRSTEGPFVDSSIYPTEKQLDIVWGAVGSLECGKIRDFLRTKCNVQNSSELELAEIVTICQARLDEQPKPKAAPANEQEKEEMIVLTQNQRKILKYLKEINTAVAQVDIESQTGLSNKTVSVELRVLKEYSFVAPPKGKARRIVITQRGVDCLNSLI